MSHGYILNAIHTPFDDALGVRDDNARLIDLGKFKVSADREYLIYLLLRSHAEQSIRFLGDRKIEMVIIWMLVEKVEFFKYKYKPCLYDVI